MGKARLTGAQKCCKLLVFLPEYLDSASMVVFGGVQYFSQRGEVLGRDLRDVQAL